MKTPEPETSLAVMERNAAEAEAMLKLLANARRLMILCHVIKTERTVGELAEMVGLSSSALSQHLAKMREQKIIVSQKKGKQVVYRIADPRVEALLSTLYLIYCKT